MDGAFATDPDVLIPAEVFTDGEDSLLDVRASFPLASFLTASGGLEMVEAADRLIAWATAMKLRALARVEEALGEEWRGRREGQPERFGGDESHAQAVAEVAAAGAVSEHAAARLLHDAADLAGDQWEVLEALEAGEVSPAHVRVILDAARTVPAECAEKFSRAALQRSRTRTGRRRTPGELRTCLRKLREQMHPETLEARRKAAVRERGVWFAPEPDGMCTLTAYLPAETGLAIYTGLDRDARSVRSSTAAGVHGAEADVASAGSAWLLAAGERTLSELRADALAHRLLGGTDALGSGASVGPFRPRVTVTMPVELALGTDQGTVAAARATAELEGYGPIDAATARRLASLAPSWLGVFTDAVTGAALGVGRKAYRPSQALRRYLAHRDGGCIFPACTHPSAGCQPGHTIEWQDGGTTDPGNLALLCPKHHALKSLGAWTYTQTPAGEFAWRSPAGRAYTTEPVGRAQPAPPPLAADPPPDPEPPPF